MSDDGTNKETTIVSEEVSVTKRLELEEFDDPVIAFDIESRRGDPATVTVVDAIPEDVSPRDLRFHPEYGSEHWVIDEGELVFEREFDPDEEYITVYRLCEAKEEVVDSFEDPTVETDSGMEASEGTGKARGMVRGAGAGLTNGGSVPDPDSGAGEAPGNEGDVPTLDLNDPVASDGAGEGQREPAEDRTTTVMAGAESAESEGESGSADGAESEGDILSENGDETLDEGEGDILSESGDETLDEGEGDILSEDDGDIPGGSEETAPNEDGPDAQAGSEATDESLVASLAAELEEGNVPDEDVERLRAALGQEESSSKSLVVRVEKLQRDVDEVLAYTDALADFLDENGTGEEMIAEFREEVDDFQAEMERFETDLEEVGTTADRTESRVDELETDLEDGFEDVRDDLTALREEVEEVRDELEDGDVDERLSTLEEDIDSLQDWRGRLASVLQEPEQ
ncbi:hypothetical protein [Salinirussus salinus]|uniref:hypothetical protein n=1 Tax=Salinirussus salinus TaxID=1198300 RepID=UPI00135C373A|nr:hypothetical protein [Salinirussus salinus]